MKKIIFVACACIMFLSVILTGCEDDGTDSDDSDGWWDDLFPTPNENVTVSLTVKVHTERSELGVFGGSVPWTIPKGNCPVVITFTVGGSTADTQHQTSGLEGWTAVLYETLMVRKDQSVTVLATIASGQAVGIVKADSKTYSWKDIWAAAGEKWGGTAAFAPSLTVIEIIKK